MYETYVNVTAIVKGYIRNGRPVDMMSNSYNIYLPVQTVVDFRLTPSLQSPGKSTLLGSAVAFIVLTVHLPA